MINRVQELEDKIDLYKKELSDLVNKLALKRTEMSTLSKQTVEMLDDNITRLRNQEPILNNNILLKEKELENLSKVIADKEIIAKQKQEDFDDKLNKEKNKLAEEYAIKEAELASKKHDFNRERSQADFKEKQYIDSVREFTNRQDEFNKLVNNFKNKEEMFEISVKNAKHNLSIKEKSIDDRSIKLDEFDNLLKQKEIELSKKEIALGYKEKQAEDIIAKLNTIEDKRLGLVELENTITERSNNINTRAVEILSNTRINNKRSSDLDIREKQLNERENRIKLLEADIAKKV